MQPLKKPFVLFDMKKNKGPVTKRMRAPLHIQKTQYEWMEPPRQSSPESALAMAVLQRAVMDLITPGVPEKERITAQFFISGAWGDEHEQSYPLSFSRIVESFTDLDVDEFRARVLSFSERAKNETGLADGFRFQRGAHHNSVPKM